MVVKKHNYFYKITNLVNGKYYYGVRSSNKEPLEDVYMGSGNAIKAAIKKYGKENFTKEIIADYSTRKEASDHEARVVTLELVDLVECYNCRTGGDNEFSYNGRPVPEEQKKAQSLKMKGRIQTEEHRRKVSESLKGVKNPMYGKTHSEETVRKIREAQTGDKSAWWGKKHTKESLEKKSKASTGGNNAMARKCVIEGEYFDALVIASKKLNITVETIGKRIRSTDSKWDNWRYVHD